MIDDFMKPKFSEDHLNTANLFKKRALSSYRNKIEKMILFGSVARGESHLGSDIDIFILWKGKRLEGIRALGEIAFKILLETEEYISLKVLTSADFKILKEKENRFIFNVTNEGMVLVG